jgi:hypothetical protein
MFRLRIDAKVIAEGLTAAQAHLLVGEVFERIALPRSAGGSHDVPGAPSQSGERGMSEPPSSLLLRNAGRLKLPRAVARLRSKALVGLHRRSARSENVEQTAGR